MYEDEDTSWSFTIGLFVGALAGAAAASLLTPRSGQQNREVVLEKGVVLKDRVTSTTSSVATSVKGTTTSAVASVKDATSSAATKVSDTVSTVREKAHVAAETVTDAASTAVTRVSETATATVEKLQDAASTAAETVSSVASTATERVSSVASTATEHVTSAASTAAEVVSSAASTAVDKVSTVTSTAADKVHGLTGRGQETPETTAPTPPASVIASEAQYDAEDVRSATLAAGTPSTGAAPAATSGVADMPANSEALQVLSSIDTFEPTMADITASTTIDPDSLALEDRSSEPATTTEYSSQFGTYSTAAAQTELRSDEQFEVTDLTLDEQSGTGSRTVAGPDPHVREASEGAERGE